MTVHTLMTCTLWWHAHSHTLILNIARQNVIARQFCREFSPQISIWNSALHHALILTLHDALILSPYIMHSFSHPYPFVDPYTIGRQNVVARQFCREFSRPCLLDRWAKTGAPVQVDSIQKRGALSSYTRQQYQTQGQLTHLYVWHDSFMSVTTH